MSYVSRTATSQGLDSDLLLSKMGLRGTVWHNRGTLELQLPHVLNSNTQTITTEGPTFYSAIPELTAQEKCILMRYLSNF
ncbi:hypothetical protein [Hymenobacter bucti]|uniref:Uncharacterized protein n=1 Tax=Hymenobacter bucti TaxID=1844114 RepID=A0ABW4R1M2_9BACT